MPTTTTDQANIHYGYFDNTTNKKWTITINGEFIKHEDLHGIQQITTWRTEAGAKAAAAKLSN